MLKYLKPTLEFGSAVIAAIAGPYSDLLTRGVTEWPSAGVG